MSYSQKMNDDQTFRFVLGCACGATRTWENEPCYVAWRAKIVATGWKADWPERCPNCKPSAAPQMELAL